jgi:hypothetical protein
MGCGGRVTEMGSVFRIFLQFIDTTTGQPVDLEQTDPKTYESFVSAITNIVHPGEWIPSEKVILLRGPIETTDKARRLSSEINRVLRGLRVRKDRSSTGVAGQVVENQGPAGEGNPNRGPRHGVSTVDKDWTAP